MFAFSTTCIAGTFGTCRFNSCVPSDTSRVTSPHVRSRPSLTVVNYNGQRTIQSALTTTQGNDRATITLQGKIIMDLYSTLILISAMAIYGPVENLKIILKIVKEIGKIIG
jgi:hypothetical protein